MKRLSTDSVVARVEDRANGAAFMRIYMLARHGATALTDASSLLEDEDACWLQVLPG